MKVLHLMDNGIVQLIALVSLWILYDAYDCLTAACTTGF